MCRPSLPRLSSAQEKNPESWEPFPDPEAMMAAAERQITDEDWCV